MSLSMVVVTGGAGFIGSHLADKLVEEGFEVGVLDNLSTGKLENISQHLKNGKIRFMKGDILDEQAVREALKNAEAVIHLAAITSVLYSVTHLDITYQVNVEGTRNLLQACIDEDVERFIYVSSCGVYGEPEHLPIDENHPLKPISPYAKTKLEAERLCMEYQENYGLKTTILRPFNVYGPRMRGGEYGIVIARFMENVRRNKPPIIYGDGEQTRDFVHVKDAVEAMVLSLRSQKAVGEILNIATGIPTSINKLAQLIIELSGVKGIKPKHTSPREGDIRHSYADIKKAKAILEYEPKISLREGLSALLGCR